MEEIDVKALCAKLKRTPEEFAREFKLPLHMVRDWMAKLYRPKGHYAVYLILIDRNPELIHEGLREVEVWESSVKSKPIV